MSETEHVSLEMGTQDETATRAGQELSEILQKYTLGEQVVILIGGKMGLGKTELGRGIKETMDASSQRGHTAVLLDIDYLSDMVEAESAAGASHNKWYELESRMKRVLQEGHSAIVTGTFARSRSREDFVADAAEYIPTTDIFGVWFDGTPEESMNGQLTRKEHPDAKETVRERTLAFEKQWCDDIQPDAIHTPWHRVIYPDRDIFRHAASLPSFQER